MSTVRVKPTASDSKAKITVNDELVSSGEASSEIQLSEGQDTRIVIHVTAEDGVTLNTYYLDVRIKEEEQPADLSKDATLSNLELIDGVLIDPDFFSPDIPFYTAMVNPYVSTVRIKPTASDDKAKITVNDELVISGDVSREIQLTEGQDTRIVIHVIAEDGVTEMTYYLDVRIEEYM